MNIVLDAINVGLFVAVSVWLWRMYNDSWQRGFLWLGLPLVLLPFLSLPIARWIKAGVDSLSAGEPNAAFPFSLVESGQLTLGTLIFVWNGLSHIVWSGCVLAALLMFKQGGVRTRTRNEAGA